MAATNIAEVDICVVGAGAAGLAAAIFAAEKSAEARICVLDGARSIGAKILVSGGGRCNVTHESVRPEDFHGNRHIIRNVLAAFDAQAAQQWLGSLGVALKREPTGKMFPVTDKARTVLNALTRRCSDLGIVLRAGHRVTTITGSRPFHIVHTDGTLTADRVILATGGRSLPKSGSDGSGYELARCFGHHVTPTVPALVPLILRTPMFHEELSGLSLDAELATRVHGRIVDRRRGSLLWTHFGISGPVVMDASRFWCLARHCGEPVEICGHFSPGWTEDQVREWLIAEATRLPARPIVSTLGQLIPERLGAALYRSIHGDPQSAIGRLTRKDRERLIAALTRFPFPIERDRGWNFAEVTAGGVPLEEINYRTMESKLVPGLYLVGELLDCDGRIGGFNFQWAWSTGYLAGRAAARPASHVPPSHVPH